MSRRDKSDKNVKHYLTSTLTEMLNKMTLNRANLLAPLPVPMTTLWKYLWSDREEHAIKLLLKECPKALDRDWAFYVAGHFNRRLEQKVAYTFNLGTTPLPMGGRALEFNILPEDMQETLIEWEVRRIELVDQGKELAGKVKAMSNVCTTYGQVNRLWPELLSFFTSVGQAKVGEARAKSKLHDDCYIWERTGEVRWDGEARFRNTGIVKEEWLPAAFARHTELIAECLMLPQAPEDSPDVTVKVVG